MVAGVPAGERVWFAGHLRECCRDFASAGSHVGQGASRRVPMVCVRGVRVGYGVAEIAFDPAEYGVSDPVSRDLVSAYPWDFATDAVPEVVVASASDDSAVAVAQELFFV